MILNVVILGAPDANLLQTRKAVFAVSREGILPLRAQDGNAFASRQFDFHPHTAFDDSSLIALVRHIHMQDAAFRRQLPHIPRLFQRQGNVRAQVEQFLANQNPKFRLSAFRERDFPEALLTVYRQYNTHMATPVLL